jgi:stage IV sporulation protein A
MVMTPWAEDPIPFAEAAEIGTRKVIAEHSTIGIVVTTDGSITELPREDYVEAERRVVDELKAIGKPFIVLLNSRDPRGRGAQELARELAAEYQAGVLPVDAVEMDSSEVLDVLREALYEFPLREVNVRLSRWIEALDEQHPLRTKAQESIFGVLDEVTRVRDLDPAVARLGALDFISHAMLVNVALGNGAALVDLTARPDLFWTTLSEVTGLPVEGDHDIVRHMTELARIKAKYDKVASALDEVAEHGYGVVSPAAEDITFEEPQLFRHGHRFGVRLRASAPTIHLIRANVFAEVMPFVGNERQGAEMLRYLTEEFEQDPTRIWNSEFLGKPVHTLVEEGLQTKLHRMPENAQAKLQEALTKIANEGSGGLICIII